MESKEFKKQMHTNLINHGFEKIKSHYYRKGSGFLCVVKIVYSNYGSQYFIDYDFFIGEFDKPYEINRYDYNCNPLVIGRFSFPDLDRENIATCYCEYLKFNREELQKEIDKNFHERILPPFECGKKYLLDNFGTLYTTFLNREKIKSLLAN